MNKAAHNTALMKGAEVYHQGMGAVEAFSSGDIKGGFSKIGKTGSSIFDLVKSSAKAAVKPLGALGANGLSYVDISNGSRNLGGKVGGVLGAIGGLGFGPLGAIAGGLGGRALGRAIGGRFDKKYPVLRGALLERGHIDAATMNPKDLYALVVSMKGPVGLQLRSHPEFKALESKVYSKNIFKTIGGGIAKAAGAVKHTAQSALMIARGTFPYRHLVSVLDQTINGNKPKWAYKEDVYTYDKYMLYASIKAMAEGTKEERTAKAALTSTKDFKKLEKAV